MSEKYKFNYIPHVPKHGSISSDNGQGMGGQDCCTKDACMIWRDGIRVGPELKLRQTFWCCPKCGTSYGANAR